MSGESDETGPIDYLVIEFPAGSRMTGEGLPLLVDLVDRGIIRILDLIFVRKNQDGTVEGVELSEVTGDDGDGLAVFEGASSGLLGQDDIDEASTVLEPGRAGGSAIYPKQFGGPTPRPPAPPRAPRLAGGRDRGRDLRPERHR
ncbi:DUF6325 family protein, partial [Streptomyces sp. NPDC057557]|uniref:DUF6325 family protein n=1 Tax=Streptomyces sp. NPDC057557 TaxID=3346167 RepID=UPI0036C6165A